MSFFNLIYKLGKKIEGNSFELTYGREILKQWAKQDSSNKNTNYKILDIGCGKGNDLINIKKTIQIECDLFGIESYEPYRAICNEKGIETHSLDIERDPLPWEDNTFDLIVINQVLEHTKDSYFVISEIHRVLKMGGRLLVGVPNLAAWHDRLAILFGQQPTCIKVPGPHVRGFTIPGFKRFIEYKQLFKITSIKGSGFLPFPITIAIRLAKIFPSQSTAIFFNCQKTSEDCAFIEVLNENFYETNYFKGHTKNENLQP
jgi:methionine biosynthesis protein MetW